MQLDSCLNLNLMLRLKYILTLLIARLGRFAFGKTPEEVCAANAGNAWQVAFYRTCPCFLSYMGRLTWSNKMGIFNLIRQCLCIVSAR